MEHTEAVSKLKDVVIDEMATPSVKSDEDDCYYCICSNIGAALI